MHADAGLAGTSPFHYREHPSQIGIHNIPGFLGRQGGEEVPRQIRVELGNAPAKAKQALNQAETLHASYN